MFRTSVATSARERAILSSGLMRRVAIIGLLMIAPMLSAGTAPKAWWLTAAFEPTQTEYLSLRASEIDPDWVALSPLDTTALPEDAARDLVWMKRDGYRFSWEGSLHKGRTTHIATGVYKAQDGSTGRFLLVLEKPTHGSWQVKLLQKDPGEPGFSVLQINEKGMFWGICMYCDYFNRIVVGRDSYRLRPS
jgi:hypothetical protein